MRLIEHSDSVAELPKLIEQYYYRAEASFHHLPPTNRHYHMTGIVTDALNVIDFHGPAFSVRREPRHIRELASEVYVIWFPRHGGITIAQGMARDLYVGPDDFLISYANRPFRISTKICVEEDCSVLSVCVPSHLFARYLPGIDKLCGKRFDRSGSARIAQQIFSGLISFGSSIQPSAARRLAEAGVEAIAASAHDQAGCAPFSAGSGHGEIEEILKYIEKNLSVCGLTADTVAKSLGMSRRKLYYILGEEGVKFSQYLWDARLRQADLLLRDERLIDELNVAQVAYLCGFQTAGHLSTAYRARYGISPRDARNVSVAAGSMKVELS